MNRRGLSHSITQLKLLLANTSYHCTITKTLMFHQLGGALNGVIGAVGAVAEALSGGGEGREGQNDEHQARARGNCGVPNVAAPPGPEASVLNPD